MNRIYDFLRRHPTWVDACWGLILLAPTILWLVNEPVDDIAGDRPANIIAAALLTVVITLRRRFPEGMLLLAIGTGIFQVIGNAPPTPSNFAFLVIIFTVATRTVPWASRLGLAGALAAPTIAELRWPSEGIDSIGFLVFNTLLVTVCFALAWVLGDSLRTRRAYYAELEARAARLERDREAQSRIAVAAERARIARELHDVVAHNVSVMVVQADGAAYVMDTAPDQARTALHTISGTGRQALTEMRRLLGVLRGNGGNGGDESGEYLPQPGLEQLDDLIQQVRDTGLPVDFRRDGIVRPLPSGVELTAYRIVQEALTNTRKHGGRGAVARIRLGYGSGTLTVLAEDDGRGAQADLYEGRGADNQGHGLIGMRERVGMVRGRLKTGPRPGGGFRITATLPLKGDSLAEAAVVAVPEPAGAAAPGCPIGPCEAEEGGEGAAGTAEPSAGPEPEPGVAPGPDPDRADDRDPGSAADPDPDPDPVTDPDADRAPAPDGPPASARPYRQS